MVRFNETKQEPQSYQRKDMHILLEDIGSVPRQGGETSLSTSDICLKSQQGDTLGV